MTNASIDLGTTPLVITDLGLAVIRFELRTLEQTGEYFQRFLDQSYRYIKYDLASDCQMSACSAPSTCIKEPNDNDGLWSSMYLASQVFHYAVTNDSKVKQNT